MTPFESTTGNGFFSHGIITGGSCEGLTETGEGDDRVVGSGGWIKWTFCVVLKPKYKIREGS
jgi:hypothetical protein